MPTPRPYRFLTFILLLAVSVSCAPQATPELTPPSELTSTAAPTPPTATPEPTRAPKEPRGSQSQQAFPTSSYLPVTSDFNIVLGRPTTDTIALNLYAKTDLQVTIAYGTASGNYTAQTDSISLTAFEPQTIELTNLTPDTLYYYTVNGIEHTFHTARPAGSTFIFTIDADPHNRDPNFNGELYAITLNNALADHPDFHIDLGDTFMTEKVQSKTYTEAESTFTNMRPYFGLLNADAPLFLVNDNQFGAADTADPATVIQGGSIVIHKAK